VFPVLEPVYKYIQKNFSDNKTDLTFHLIFLAQVNCSARYICSFPIVMIGSALEITLARRLRHGQVGSLHRICENIKPLKANLCPLRRILTVCLICLNHSNNNPPWRPPRPLFRTSACTKQYRLLMRHSVQLQSAPRTGYIPEMQSLDRFPWSYKGATNASSSCL
jgi:hypothetical protein